MHHIITDRISLGIIANKINKYYNEDENNVVELNKSNIQFSDYAIYLSE